MIYDLQKASMLKRLSAFILDAILISILAVGFSLVVSWITKYDDKNQNLDDYYTYYSEEYGVDFNIDAKQYEELSDEQKEQYGLALKAFNDDKEALKAYNLVVNLTLIMITISILLSTLCTNFILPLILKNGQTVGKKIFGICLMKQNGVQVNTLCLFVRSVLGQFTIETMIPVYIIIMIFYGKGSLIGLKVLLLIFIVQIAILIITKTNSAIHDALAYTVVVDKASQMIFSSEEAMIKYKEEVHRNIVDKTSY